MPRNRAHVARDDKVDEIVTAARRRLVEGGYASLSVADLARQLGVAQNAIYWYFPTKDDLFVAAVERILHDVLAKKPRTGSCLGQVLWFAERLNEFQDLRITMRERSRSSKVVADFEADVVALLRVLLMGALSHDVPAKDLDATADAVMALCEGALLRDNGRAERARTIRFAFERLVPHAGVISK